MRSTGDVLGDQGRKALDSCVKVKIFGTPDQNIPKYHWYRAWNRLNKCYAGGFPAPSFGQPGWLKRGLAANLLLPTEWNRDWTAKDRICDIIEIHDALENFDKMPFVEKYPKPGPRSDELTKLIDKRRADIERECEKAIADPKTQCRYSWLVAQRRVRDCYAGSFAGDRAFLEDKHPNELYSIIEIYNAVVQHDTYYEEQYDFERRYLKKVFLNKTFIKGPGSEELKKSIEKHNSEVKKEYMDAKRGLHRYSQGDAEMRMKGCFFGSLQGFSRIKEDESGEPNTNKTYDIIDIYNNVLHHRKKVLKMGHMHCLHRMSAVENEYQMAKSGLGKYSRSEAERRARDCFVGTLRGDTEIFPTTEKEKTSGIPKIKKLTYDIFDIKNAIDYYDAKKLRDKYLQVVEKTYDFNNSKRRNQLAKDERNKIEEEYGEATAKGVIEHGSGFIVHDHFIITNKHVIADAENDETKEIYVSSAAIGELLCEVSSTDAGKDLALLYCPELNLKQNGICPLQLSNQPLLPGMQVFSFGYPISHTGEAGLFVNGHVSGSKETFSGHTMIVLNCALNSGNSGGPVLSFIGGQLKVVGVATQKHFKQILTLNEREKIEKIRESLQTSTICSISDKNVKGASSQFLKKCKSLVEIDPLQTPMFLLTLKLYDALETHSQFNLSNALRGHCVVEFIQETISKYHGQGKEELLEIVKWSEDHANILLSGHHSASDCCIQ